MNSLSGDVLDTMTKTILGLHPFSIKRFWCSKKTKNEIVLIFKLFQLKSKNLKLNLLSVICRIDFVS